jgi:hypothetical protein
MNILDVIMNAQGGEAVRQLGSQFGLGEQETATALGALVPALAAGFQRNLQDQGGMGSLLDALSAGNHKRYIDHPEILGDPAAVADGNGILGHVLGSKDVSRAVARQAAERTGLSPDLLKQILPLVAAMMMGAFARQSAGARSAGPAGRETEGGGLMDMLGPLLDRNRDGSVVDDMAGILGRFLGGPAR